MRSKISRCHARQRRSSRAPSAPPAWLQENPLGLAIGATAFVSWSGMLVPSTKIEDERIGPMADEIKEKAGETGREAMERGKEVAQQAAEGAEDRQAGQEHARGCATARRRRSARRPRSPTEVAVRGVPSPSP